MSQCGLRFGFHGEHECRLNDEHGPVSANRGSEVNPIWLHICWCGFAWEAPPR